METIEHRLVEYLRTKASADNPITGAKIARVLGIKGSVRVRGIVNLLRAQYHIPIASCRTGYFIAQTPEQLTETKASLHGRALSILRALGGIKKSFNSDRQGRLAL